MTEADVAAQPPPAAAPPPPVVVAAAWPSLEPIAQGSPIFEVWGGFAAPCPDCGFMFVEKTPEAARETVTYREDVHGKDYCREAAAKLSQAKKAWLRQLYEEPSALVAQQAKPAKTRKASPRAPPAASPAGKRARKKREEGA